MQRVRVSSKHSPVFKLGDSQLSLSPKFRVAAIKSHLVDPSSDLELAIKGQPLIPGLPDDVALNCLLRLPVQSHGSCRAVCKRWHLLLGSKERFFSRRKELGLCDPWLFVLTFHKCTGKIQWLVLDLTHFTWHTIPEMPCRDKVCPHGFRCVSVPSEGTLFVCGGMVSDMDCPLDVVLKYEIHKNRWTVMNQMITARSFFASGVIDGMVYVAGGNSADLYELDAAEVLDPVRGCWHPIANMGTNMASYDAAVLDGKLLVTEGWLWPFFVSPRGQVYDPINDNWENMAVGLREGWTGSSVVVYGCLFIVSEHERMKLKVYDGNSDSWDTVEGPPLPEQICKPFSVNSYDSKIYVVGRDLHVAVGQILKVNLEEGHSEKKLSFAVQWHVEDAPMAFSDLTPSSSQVLFA
ncbi:F-box/kelch-repeat protein At1g30090-like [Chenopodium quinoa]|uniref:F-box domain-containing protein n=1 Tax=Chenopodium quinoa TaxID=63459 RepID=A0A803LL60_CHEQI|nr:F-box/kelch-repeat protein At1g30090-like [Chenopodium quinoa]